MQNLDNLIDALQKAIDELNRQRETLQDNLNDLQNQLDETAVALEASEDALIELQSITDGDLAAVTLAINRLSAAVNG